MKPSIQSAVSQLLCAAEHDLTLACALAATGNTPAAIEAGRRVHKAYGQAQAMLAAWLWTLPAVNTVEGELLSDGLPAVRAIEARIELIQLHLHALGGMVPEALAAE